MYCIRVELILSSGVWWGAVLLMRDHHSTSDEVYLWDNVMMTVSDAGHSHRWLNWPQRPQWTFQSWANLGLSHNGEGAGVRAMRHEVRFLRVCWSLDLRRRDVESFSIKFFFQFNVAILIFDTICTFWMSGQIDFKCVQKPTLRAGLV